MLIMKATEKRPVVNGSLPSNIYERVQFNPHHDRLFVAPKRKENATRKRKQIIVI